MVVFFSCRWMQCTNRCTLVQHQRKKEEEVEEEVKYNQRNWHGKIESRLKYIWLVQPPQFAFWSYDLLLVVVVRLSISICRNAKIRTKLISPWIIGNLLNIFYASLSFPFRFGLFSFLFQRVHIHQKSHRCICQMYFYYLFMNVS